MFFTEKGTPGPPSTRPATSCSHSYLADLLFHLPAFLFLSGLAFSFHDPYFSDLIFDDIWDNGVLSLLCSKLD